MKLRKDIQPQMDIAEQLYPKILELIEGYETYVDEVGDEDMSEYRRIESVVSIDEIVERML